MVSLIPDKNERIDNSNIIGEKLYQDKWKKIIDGIVSVDPNFGEFIREIPYGSIFPREGLSLQFREIAAITTLTQQNLLPQLKSHIIGAINVGISREEISELFLHIALFIGFPKVLDALKVAKEVFDHYKL